jgi:transcription termination/antitermination protein NusG
MIFVVKVITNKEEQAAELIAGKAEKKGLQVYSVIRPHGLRGYILIESEDYDAAQQAALNVPYVKSVIFKSLDYKEVENIVEPVVTAINIEKGDIVEILAEPFKREKAKVVRVDKQKEEVIVELLEAAVQIPITVKLDNVKVIRRTKEEGDDKNF